MTGCACGQMYCNGCMDEKAADQKPSILPGKQVSEESKEEDPKGSKA